MAADHAACGWYVFPIAPGGKLPIFHSKDRCRGRGVCRDGHQGWEQRATCEQEQITRWWDGTRAWNVGLACGPSGLLVVDLDVDDAAGPQQGPGGRRNGVAELARLAARHDAVLPDTYCTVTPSGGAHYYFRAPDDLDLTISQGRLGPGIDTRGRGGLVVAAGSVRPEGRYQVSAPGPIADLPRWLAMLLVPDPPRRVATEPRVLSPRRADAYVERVINIRTTEVSEAKFGKRQWTLKVAARRLGQYVGGGELDEREAYERLYSAARKHIGIRGMDHREVDSAIRGGMAYGMQAPIRLSDN